MKSLFLKLSIQQDCVLLYLSIEYFKNHQPKVVIQQKVKSNRILLPT